ncbi:hypothetical protein BASA81_015415 [Batrachochytrium salamandrivorans]|nr:hypothetical protein BASA81_015415 [Batrachochytrium salamandrivorans]
MQALLDSLLSQSPTPALRSPPSTGIPKGLDRAQFETLLAAICASRHFLLAARSVPLLVPKGCGITPKDIELIMLSYTHTDFAALRSAWCKYLQSVWDAGVLSARARDTLHASYGVLFYFMFHSANTLVQIDIARLVYRLTRKVDVTAVRCLQLSQAMAKPNSSPVLVALGELFCTLRPTDAEVTFPALEHGVVGKSGLTAGARAALHLFMTKHRNLVFTRRLQSSAVRFRDQENADEGEEHIAERVHSLKRFKPDKDSNGDVNGEEEEEEESQLVALLPTWDGIANQAEMCRKLGRLEFPLRKPHQDSMWSGVFAPLIDLLLTAPLEVHYPVCRQVGKLLAHWTVREEKSTSYVTHVTAQFDDLFCQLCCLGTDGTIQASVFEFYHQLAMGWVNRPKVLQTAAGRPPSEFLCLWFLLSPNLLGLANMCQVLTELVPVYQMEAVAGEQTHSQGRIQTSKLFDTLCQDYCNALVLGRGQQPFVDSAVPLLPEIEFALQGDELGVNKSFALRAAWQLWLEDRDEQEDDKVTEERLAAFLLWLKQQHGVPELANFLAQVSMRFRSLLRLPN